MKRTSNYQQIACLVHVLFFTDVEENFVLRSESTCVFEKYDDGTNETPVYLFRDPIFGTTCLLKILFQRCDMKRLLISSVYIFTLNYYRQNKHRNMSNTEELTRDGKGIFGTSTKSLKYYILCTPYLPTMN